MRDIDDRREWLIIHEPLGGKDILTEHCYGLKYGFNRKMTRQKWLFEPVITFNKFAVLRIGHGPRLSAVRTYTRREEVTSTCLTGKSTELLHRTKGWFPSCLIVLGLLRVIMQKLTVSSFRYIQFLSQLD